MDRHDIKIIKTYVNRMNLLYSSDDYRHVVGKERELQIFENAIKSELYFNLRIANEVGNYHALGYAIYRHRENGMTMKLRTDDDLVLNGTYIHIKKKDFN